jgi:hypothetical protein
MSSQQPQRAEVLSSATTTTILDTLVHIWTVMEDHRNHLTSTDTVVEEGVRCAKDILKAAGYEVKTK